MSMAGKPWFVYLVLLFFFFSFRTCLSIAADTISSGQSITGNQTIMSQHGIFELGFFTPGNSRNYYIGIWYKQISVQTVVWVANRDKPLPNTSSRLKISGDGNLVLLNQFNISIWSSNLSSNSLNSTLAVLLDSGNLVLRDGSNYSVVIWQSFEHPTDTWLPGGRLGSNKITGESQLLASWRNSENPSPGIFSLEIDPNGSSQYYLVWNRSQRYWTSGVWDGRIFSLVPEMTGNYFFDFTYVSNEKENYFTYTVKDSSLLARFVMDLSGQIKQFTWLNTTQEWLLLWTKPNDQCEAYLICGTFGICTPKSFPFCECLQGFKPRSPKDWNLSDWSGGCARTTPLKCGSYSYGNDHTDDGFLMLPNMQFPTNTKNFTVKNAHECKLACLSNCSCSAYAYSSVCSIWSGGLWNLKQLSEGGTNGDDIYLRLSASDLPSSKGKKRKTLIGPIVGVVAGVLILLSITFVLIFIHWRRMLIRTSKIAQGSLVPFGYRDLQNMTKNFAEKLGGGGFGSVFKGTLPDSTAIAVKKLEGLNQGEKQFRTEVSTIGTIQHVNLVRLRGFCSEGTQRLLVYDYVPNGSLETHLFYKDDTNILDWKTRYQIALGTARGLDYLHEKCRDCIIHCDIKPGNILLDSEFCAKVADFGLAKIFGRDFSRVLTTMRGTRGYLAPEWISGLAITPKADVYSYGMMLFEIISGRRNITQHEDGKVDFFPTRVASQLHNNKEVVYLVDHKLEGNVNVEELTRACKVACWCIQDDEKDRPSMGQIVQILEKVLEVETPPIPLYLQTLLANQEASSHKSGTSTTQFKETSFLASAK